MAPENPAPPPENLAAKLHAALVTIALQAINQASALQKAVTGAQAETLAALYFRQDLLEESGPGSTLSAPANLQLTAAGSESINATWDAVEGATGYLLRRKGPGETEFTVVADVAGLEAQAGGLTPGDSYLFTIAAYNDDAESEPGGEVPYQA